MSARAARVIEGLIADATPADLFRRLESIPDENLARRLFVDAVALGKVPFARVAVVMIALQHLGLGDQGERLCALLLDYNQPIDRRAMALQMLGRFDREVHAATVNKLDSDDLMALSTEPVVQMASRAVDDPRAAEDYGGLLARLSGEMQIESARRVERQRQRLLIPAVKLHAHALSTPGTEPVRRQALRERRHRRSPLP